MAAERFPEVRPELVERYRQLRIFDRAEVALVRGLVSAPPWAPRLAPRLEQVLRWALNLARLWVVEAPDGPIGVGPKLTAFRHRLQPVAEALARGTEPGRLGPEAHQLIESVTDARAYALSELAGTLSAEHLDREVRSKALVLVLGGGGGCGYIHMGAFSLLEDIGLRPHLVVGASMGAIMGAFRAREHAFHEARVRGLARQLSYKRMFRALDAETRYAMPGVLRLHLRSTLGRYFQSPRNDPMRISDLEIPFASVVTGLRREAMRDVQRYERLFLAQLRRGPLARLIHIKDMVGNLAALVQELTASPDALTDVALGLDNDTEGFDVLDAIGFSAAVPALLQYDITREDPRMHALMRSTLDRFGVDVFADGGLVDNVPARAAWEYVQAGGIGTRNVFILGLDCFAPRVSRNLLFLPIQRVAAQTVVRNEPFTHLLHRYRRALPATMLIPGPDSVEAAFASGRADLDSQASFLRKMMEPLPERWSMLGD